MRRRRAVLVLGVFTCAGAPRLSAEPPAPSVLESSAPLAAALRARFGDRARILGLSMRPDGAEIQVQDPAVPAHVDEYAFADGLLQAPEPVQVGRNRKQVEKRLFDLADVDLSILPRLLADAQARARTEDARVTQVAIERTEGYGDSASWGRPLIRVHVDGPRGGALVEYELDGTHKGVSRW